MKLRSFQDLDVVAGQARSVLTLFSGGLDSTYLLKELARRDVHVVALAVDVGDEAHRGEMKATAERFGAEFVMVDARDRFARDAVLPALRAQAQYMNLYPISSSLSRPVLAQVAVELARERGCNAILHTANQSQNSLRRLNGAIEQLGFDGWYGTPYEFSVLSRDEKMEQLRACGLRRFQSRGVSGDANLWCREFESGALDNPEGFWVPESLYEWTATPARAAERHDLSVRFEHGLPVEVDGQAMAPTALIGWLNRRAGAYGIGRFAGLEHLEGGEKVLEVREAPAAAVLMQAYRHLECATLDAELLRVKQAQEQLWVREAIEGRWFGPLRQAADAFIASTAARVSGSVQFHLRAGAADLCAVRAQRPLYLTDRDGWERQIAQQRSCTTLAGVLPTAPAGTPLRPRNARGLAAQAA